MLVEAVLLVFAAVVLTVFAVGYLGGVGGKVNKVKTIDGGSVAGRYSDGLIDVAEAIKSVDGPIYRLNEKEQKVVVYHEKFHELASKLGYTEQAGREDYADLAAIYALIIEGDKETASEGVEFLNKIGRADYINETSISAINKYLSGKQGDLTPAEMDKLERGIARTGKLINEAYDKMSEREHGLSEVYHMRLSPILREKGGEGKSRIGNIAAKARDFFYDLYDESHKVNQALEKSFDPEKGYKKWEYPSGTLFEKHVLKPLHLNKGGAGKKEEHLHH